MKLATISNLKKYYGDRLILDIDKFEIEEEDKIGIVGENGAGKTTLLKIIIGEIKADEGKVHLTDSYSYISQLEERCITCEVTKVKKIFNSPSEYKEYLSGGEKVKIQVVNALSENRKLIIADEPTSNSDSESIKILDNMFSKYKGALLVVSHDRNFLNHICNKIVEIEDGKIKIYKGNYDDYKRLKEENISYEENEYKKYISEKKRLEQVISAKKVLRDRIKKAPKGMGKSEAKTIKMGDQRGKKNIENNIKSVEKRIEHMDVKKKPKRQQQIVININDGCEITAKNLIEIINYNLKVNNKILLENINLKIVNGVKAALIGENGCGKTSLLNRIMDFMQDKEVNGVKVAKGVKIGYFHQKQDMLDEDKSILENMKIDSTLDECFIRTNLSEFGFKDNDVHKLVGCLSGGERVKAAICKIILADNNFLMLDEPTNYLDIKAIDALENALINTNKTILLVSHDLEFIDNVCNYIIAIKDKHIFQFNGTYNKYLEQLTNNETSEDERHINDEILLLENKLSKVISELSIVTDEEVKKTLNNEYMNIMNELKQLKEKNSK